MKTKKERGFTLIELLVVLAIIGILAALILSNLATARKKARDSRRKTDVRALGAALEMWSDDHAYVFPTTEDAAASPVAVISPILGEAYIKQVPAEPVSGRYYFYSGATDGTDYAFFSRMEADPEQWFCTSSGSSGMITTTQVPTSYQTCVP